MELPYPVRFLNVKNGDTNRNVSPGVISDFKGQLSATQIIEFAITHNPLKHPKVCKSIESKPAEEQSYGRLGASVDELNGRSNRSVSNSFCELCLACRWVSSNRNNCWQAIFAVF